MWAEIEPRAYERRIDPCALIRSFLIAYVLQLPGLRAVAARNAKSLSGCAMSSLSFALRRASSLRMAETLVQSASQRGGAWTANDRIALDSMWVTLPETYRHGCKKVNAWTVGGGALWAFNLRARRGSSPVQVLKVMRGAWHDARAIAGVKLQAHGPTYLMDRGFYALDRVQEWTQQGVRFILRAKRRGLTYRVEREIGPTRRVNPGLSIEVDAVVRLGGPHRRHHPLVRLVHARIAGDDPLILVSNRMDLSAEELLGGYRERWQIERFHRELKRTIGLAHLYSFQQNGLEFLTYVAVLLALLLIMADAQDDGSFTLDRLHHALAALRRACGIWGTWAPNTHPRTPRVKRLKAKRLRRENR